MTIKPSLPRGPLVRLFAPALACAVLLGGTLPAFAQFGTTACTFRNNDISNSLRQSIADKLGISRNQVQIPIIMVPTFNPDLGQPGVPTPTGITLCTNSQLVASVQGGVTQTTPFPSGESADVQEVQQSSYVLVNGNLMKICQADFQTGCVVITKK